MARTIETAIQKRFCDIDPFQHVNNVAQQSYFDVGKVDYYERILGAEVLLGDLRIVTVSTSTSYMGQVRMHDDVRVTTTCERIGTKSLTLFPSSGATASRLSSMGRLPNEDKAPSENRTGLCLEPGWTRAVQCTGVSPRSAASRSMRAWAASYSLGISPSRMAFLITSLISPITRHGPMP